MSRLILQNKLNGIFGIFGSQCFAWAFNYFCLADICLCILLFPILFVWVFSVCKCVSLRSVLLVTFLAIFLSVCVLLFWLILYIISINCYYYMPVYFLMRERKGYIFGWGWVSGQNLGRIGNGKNNQNILYVKVFLIKPISQRWMWLLSAGIQIF